MKTKYIISLTCLFLLLSCKTNYIVKSSNNHVLSINSSVDTSILNIVYPYKNKIEKEMNRILCYTSTNLKKKKPQSRLGNFVVDLCLDYADVDFCIMNNGGLRTEIDKGPITVGKIYELMPFENELVVIEVDKEVFKKIIEYIVSKNGEPFFGAEIILDKYGKLIDYKTNFDLNKKNKIKILTTDYLANGGDDMFFLKNIKQKKIGTKLRDAILDYCSRKDTLNIELDNRIIVNEK